MEDRSRRNNLRFDGLAESQGESWEQPTDKIYHFMEAELDINCSNIIIERAHLTGRHRVGKPRAVVAKFLNYNDRSEILRNCKKLKGTKFCVYEDFSKDTVNIIKEIFVLFYAQKGREKVEEIKSNLIPNIIGNLRSRFENLRTCEEFNAFQLFDVTKWNNGEDTE